MKNHELIAELLKLDPNEEVHFDNGYAAVPVSSVRIVPLNQPRKKGANRSYPHGDGVKRCKHKGIVLFDKFS